MIAEFRAGEKIKSILLCRVQKVGNSSNGGVFARGTVSDNSASMPFVCFEAATVEHLKGLMGAKPLLLSGLVDINRFAGDGSLQLMLHKADEVKETDDLSHLLPSGDIDIKKYTEKLTALLQKINDPDTKRLLETIFSGETLNSFKSNPAAMTYHHAYTGGLLQHSVDVAELGLAMCGKVKGADSDLVIAGGLLHDIGKLLEISQDIGFPYTDEGKFIGHIPLGAMMVNGYAANMAPPLSDQTLNELLHIILSHHGEQEKGSPITCRTKEAFIVHYADEMDSVLNQFETAEGDGWQFNKMLSRSIFIKE